MTGGAPGGAARNRARGARVPPLHLVALVAYLGVLAAELPRLTEQLRANSDVASVLLVGNSIARGTAGRPIEAGQPAYAWLVAALEWVGHQGAVWSVVPLLVAWLGVAGVVLALARVSGRWSAGLGLALGAGAAPAVLITEVAPAFHGMAWAAAGLLGWYAVAAVDRPMRGRALMLSAVAGALAGAVAASDALAVVAGLLPFAAVTLLVWLRARRVARIAGPVVLLGAAALSFIAVHAYMVVAGYSSGLGGGRTRGLAIGAIAGNARVVGRGLLDMADGLPMEPGAPLAALPMALAVGLIAVAVAGVVVVTRRHAVTPANGGGLRGQVHVTYWVVSAVLLLAALVVSNVVMPGGDAPPADRLVSSQRYLTGIFLATVALLPLWARARHGRMAATFVVTLVVAASAVRLVAAASNDDFQPAASRAIPMLAQALHTHGLSHGYASYWDADVLRLSSGGALDVAPAAEGTQCGAGTAAFCRELLNGLGGWFVDRPGRSFVVVDPGDSFIPKPPPASLGVPVQIFSADRFTVYVYADDVLPRFATTCAGRADHVCAG